MKIQLDYNEKVITIIENVNLSEFVAKIENILPDWVDWKLEANTQVNWTYPIVINEPYIEKPWWERPIYGSPTAIPTTGTYCLEIN